MPARKTKKDASWREDHPKKGKEREDMMSKCGSRCFLMPKERKFPICTKCGDDCSCRPDCRGLKAARTRAAQMHYTQVKEAADRLIYMRNCEGSKVRKMRGPAKPMKKKKKTIKRKK